MMLIETCVDLHSSPNIIRVTKLIRMRWAGHVARKEGEERGGSLGRIRRRWEDNIQMDPPKRR